MTTVYPCCKHCDHDMPWGGSDSLTDDQQGHTVPCAHCHADGGA